jgi:predicted O-methyltransferase YrrM
MTPQRWAYTDKYLNETFGAQDDEMATHRDRAVAAGLPDIAVTPELGRLIMIMTSMTRGRLAVEAGTLGGYSSTWITRGLRPDGRLITLEYEAKHADFAQAHFERVGLADRIEIRRGDCLEILPRLVDELEPGSVDVVFLDAIKVDYPKYWRIARPLIAPGGLIMADNALGSHWWMDQEDDPSRIGVDEFNRAVASDPEFEAMIAPVRQGLLIGRRSC